MYKQTDRMCKNGTVGRRSPAVRPWSFALLAALAAAPIPAGGLTEGTRARLRELIRPPLVAERTSVLVLDTRDGEVLFAHNPGTPVMPASTMKLYVGATALARLGPGFRYQTPVVAADTYLSDGVIDGDLCVGGKGDPSWTDDTLKEIVQRLRDLGVTRIEGGVRCDDGVFGADRLGRGWPERNLLWYFSMESSAVCLTRNAVDVSVLPGAGPGMSANVTLAREVGYLTLDNAVRTVAPGGRLSVHFEREPDSRTIRVGGTIAAGSGGFEQGMSVPKPALYVAHCLTARLKEAGVAVAGKPALGSLPAKSTLVAVVRSDPLLDLVSRMEKWSDNHAAEQFLRTLAYRCDWEGTAAAGVRVIKGFLSEHGIDQASCQFLDGSGLSPLNRVTGRSLASLLHHVWSLPIGRTFADSLSVAGQDGTLRRRMVDTPAAGVVRAKTGTLRGACALAGYVFVDDDAPLAFAFVANGYTGGASAVRRLQDEFCAVLATTDNAPRP